MRKALAFLLMPLVLLASGSALAADAFNRVVVVIDSSGSFAPRAPQAVEKVVRLLDDYAARKERRTRSRHSDEISVIALDAAPEVIFTGTLAELRKIDRKGWIARFNARREFGACTDVVAAFNLAVEVLGKAPAADGTYLFGFSDLIDEPAVSLPEGRGRMKCRSARYAPAPDFPWPALAEMQTRVYLSWLPSTQAVRWQQKVREEGLAETVKVLSEAETPVQALLAPPPARKVLSSEEKELKQAVYVEGASSLMSLVGYVMLLLGGLFVLLIGLAIALRGRRRGLVATPSRPAPPIPRLNINRR